MSQDTLYLLKIRKTAKKPKQSLKHMFYAITQYIPKMLRQRFAKNECCHPLFSL